MLLVIDNYDSFVHNLARYLQRLGQETHVVRNDAVTISQISELAPAALVLSPGPGTPHDAGRSQQIVEHFAASLPMLGVCLGHQTLAAVFGGRVCRAREPVHGRSSLIYHSAQYVFQGLPSPLRVGRYHSLVVDTETLPTCLQPLAQTSDGVLMAFAHTRWPLVGLQFHPESVLTDHGYDLLAGFLRMAGLRPHLPVPPDEMPWRPIDNLITPWPTQPITF